jgi:hypothetical protein
MTNLEEFNGRHAGCPVFILAAGTSLHFQDLDQLRGEIVIAVNSGIVAAPWAKYFVSDDWSVERWSYFNRDLRSLDTTVLLYEDKLGKCADWFGDRSVLFRHRKGLVIPDSYSHTDKDHHIGETRTSVGSAIMIAHIMGGSPIYLLGVDGRRQYGKRYFWQLNPHLSPYDKDYVVPKRNDRVPVDRYRLCKLNQVITDFDLKDISRTWKDFGDAVNRKCRVYNASDVSTIRVFPKISFDRMLEDMNGSRQDK